MAICRNPNCGMENPDDLEYCKFCGRRLKELKNNSKKPLMILIGLAMIILVLIAYKAFLGQKPSQIAKTPTNNQPTTQAPTTQKQPATQQPIGIKNIKFAFVRAVNNAKEIFVNNANGTIVKVTNSGAENDSPSWSPDGTKIAFERKEGNTTNIYVINENGTGEKKLAEGQEPTWSNDGSLILFYQKDPNSLSNILYSIKPDGTGLNKVTTTADSYYMARYSPDGSKIAITKYSTEGWGIYVVGPDMSGRVALFTSPKTTSDPSWSADGKKIAFTSEKDGNDEIYTVDMNKNVVRITNNPAADTNPSFTADGKIIFTRTVNGASDIYITDGTTEKLLLKNAAFGAVASK